ncbi:MAG: hypothetical protein H7268_15995, partial [Sandarakinorhabdus sp.]|nr:hypothetical protein [Sandarakinorhabdus sp.]
MSVTDNFSWKRGGPEYEAGCRVAPDELRRSLVRIAALTGADLVLLLRRRGDGSRFIRIAGTVNGGGNADDLAAAATRFPATVTTRTDSLSPDARMIVHWLAQPGDGGFVLVLAVRADRPPFDADGLRSVAAVCEWDDDVVDLWWTNRRSEARATALRAALGNGGTHVILLDSLGMIVEA